MLNAIHNLLWGSGTLVLLLGSGIFLTIRLRFLPWRMLGSALRSALGQTARKTEGSGVSPFSALMTALAATLGTGNIVGVATALVAGGPGALVWMELSALVGISTIFAESTLAVKYRQKNRHGEWVGGPMYVMEAALGPFGKLLGLLFSFFAVGASFGIGSMTQANAMAGALDSLLNIPPLLVGVVTAGLALVVILGGIRSISKVSTALVPTIAVLYLLAGIFVILGNWEQLPTALERMLHEAFSFRAVSGGGLGTAAARWGIARGVFSNEAGLGSAAIAAASAETRSAVRQGYISMTAPFFDTIIMCTVTGLAICCSGVLGTTDVTGQMVDGAALTILAFETVFGSLGGGFVALSIVLFAFSTILGWEYLGETTFTYLTGGRLVLCYRILFALAALWGANACLDTVFCFSDICNAFMCIPNLFCLLLLSGEVAQETCRFQRYQRGKKL